MKKIVLLLITVFNLFPFFDKGTLKIGTGTIYAQAYGNENFETADGLSNDEWMALTSINPDAVETYLENLDPGDYVSPQFFNQAFGGTDMSEYFTMIAIPSSGPMSESDIAWEARYKQLYDLGLVSWIDDTQSWTFVYQLNTGYIDFSNFFTDTGIPPGWYDDPTYVDDYFPSDNNFVDDPTRQTVDITTIMNCFDNISDNGAKFSVELLCDLPDNHNSSAMFTLKGDPGHTFIRMQKTNAAGTQTITQTFGFYPLSTWKSIGFIPVTSAIVNNGNGTFSHEYNASMTMNNLTYTQWQTLISTAKTKAANDYDLNDYNCTNYALDIFNSIRSSNDAINSVPVWLTPTKYFAQSPAGLYQGLELMKYIYPNVKTGVVNSATPSNCN